MSRDSALAVAQGIDGEVFCHLLKECFQILDFAQTLAMLPKASEDVLDDVVGGVAVEGGHQLMYVVQKQEAIAVVEGVKRTMVAGGKLQSEFVFIEIV